jgi:hypothetical protein
LSHDQRPGKIRVVRDASAANGTRRRGDASAAMGVAARPGTSAANGATGMNAAVRAAAAKKTLPMLQAGIFLLACVIGGVGVAILRPF